MEVILTKGSINFGCLGGWLVEYKDNNATLLSSGEVRLKFQDGPSVAKFNVQLLYFGILSFD
jgi:hypothetical protein